MGRQRVLLLNPPGRQAYVRDCYCSTVAKEAYYPHPLDLLLQSGMLSRDFDISFIDGTASRMTPSEALRHASDFRPDAVFFLTGSHAREEDLPLLEGIHETTGARMVGSGDFLRFGDDRLFDEIPWLDAILDDFVTGDLAAHLADPEGPVPSNLRVRRSDGSIERGPVDRNDTFSIPLPRHDLLPLDRYQLPFRDGGTYASVLTHYGCVASCTFCHAMRLGSKLRDMDNLAEELHYLSTELGLKRIFFRDPTFTLDGEHARAVCEVIGDLELEWNCWSRIDTVDGQLLRAMRDAGCQLIQFGVEVGQDDALARHGKRYESNLTHEVLAECRSLGIETLGHFMLGLPGEDPGDDPRTVQFARRLPLDYASFNVFEHRPGTRLGDRPDRAETPVFYDSGPLPTAVSDEEGRRRRRRAMASFYLRPSLIGRHLARSIRSPRQLGGLVARGGALMAGLVGPRR